MSSNKKSSSNGNLDFNINDYTVSELTAICGLTDQQMNQTNITNKTNELINQYSGDSNLSSFFKDAQKKLLQNVNQGNPSYPAGMKTISDSYKNENQKQPDENQTNKITDRKQKIDTYGNNHLPMFQQQLGVNNNYSVPYTQDSLNPTLKNTTIRFVNLDSQFRQSSNGAESTPSDYTLDLSDPLINVLNMKLYSFQIVYSWYTIDESYGNTCFWITNENNNIPITIASGNYSSTEFVTTLNAAFQTAGFNTSLQTPVLFNTSNGLITLNLYNLQYNGTEPFIITTSSVITFFDYTARLQCVNNCNGKGLYIDQTLGWVMGFRQPYETVVQTGNTASTVLNLNGTKYLILVIDDYNQNHINNGLVSITEIYNVIKTPSYYSPDLPYTCLPPTAGLATSNTIMNEFINNENNGILIADKLNTNITYEKTIQMIPSAPRLLTQAQIYTINEIFKKNNNTNQYRSRAPTTPDIFCILPVKTGGLNTGSLIVEIGGSLQQNMRTYFGPVNIERMRVKLYDDKGNLLNLNGGDWCVTFMCECLYQY